MNILAIETSCDDTACAVVTENKKVLANIVQSQIKEHSVYYGIVPEIASRRHLENINAIAACALSESQCTFDDIDAFAVTTGPGLPGSLLIGAMTAKTFSLVFRTPVVPVHHATAHIWANFLEHNGTTFTPSFPAIVLLVSGGHTELCLMKNFEEISVLGRTRDDAAGEAFDKVAKILDLGYPGGPIIDTIAGQTTERIQLPRPMLHGTDDFSFSGLKTAVLYYNKSHAPLSAEQKHALAASFQDVVVDVLVKKTIAAARKHHARTIMLSGGVAANTQLRRVLSDEAAREGIAVHMPPVSLCTDNAAMVGARAVDLIACHSLQYFADTVKTNPLFLSIKPNGEMEGS